MIDAHREPEAMVRAPSDQAVSSGLDRALQVVFAIADSGQDSVGVSELARELRLPKAVVHRILKTLTARAFLSFDERSRRYRLGPGALIVGFAAIRNLNVPALARPHLEGLVAATGETATLSVLQAGERIYVDQVLSPQEIRMSVVLGRPFPLHAGSSSKAILATLPAAEAAAHLRPGPLPRLTGATIVEPEALERELERIRRRGYAVSFGERQEGAGSVAAAVLESTGRVFGSMSVCGPVTRFQPDRVRGYGELVRDAAARLSAEIGFRAGGIARRQAR